MKIREGVGSNPYKRAPVTSRRSKGGDSTCPLTKHSVARHRKRLQRIQPFSTQGPLTGVFLFCPCKNSPVDHTRATKRLGTLGCNLPFSKGVRISKVTAIVAETAVSATHTGSLSTGWRC